MTKTNETMTYDQRREAERKEEEAVRDVLREIAPLLGPQWSAENQEERATIAITNGLLKMYVSWDRRTNRVNVQSWQWPRYTETVGRQGNSDNTGRVHVVSPSDLYDPKESLDSISIAFPRGPAVMAAEIKRRFLPEYARIYQRCQDKADASQKYHDKAAREWQTIADLVGGDSTRGTLYIHTEFGLILMQNRNGKAHFDLDVSADQMPAILAALGHRKEPKTDGE